MEGGRAVACLVPLLQTGKATSGRRALDPHVVISQTVEAAPHKILWYRARSVSRGRTTPAAPALHLSEALGIRWRAHTHRVDDDGPEAGLACRVRTRHFATRRGHEAGRLSTAALSPSAATRSDGGLPLPGRRRGGGGGVGGGVLRVREANLPPRRGREGLRAWVKRAGPEDVRRVRRGSEGREAEGAGLRSGLSRRLLLTLVRRRTATPRHRRGGRP
jgi:hypothetical protein